MSNKIQNFEYNDISEYLNKWSKKIDANPNRFDQEEYKKFDVVVKEIFNSSSFSKKTKKLKNFGNSFSNEKLIRASQNLTPYFFYKLAKLCK